MIVSADRLVAGLFWSLNYLGFAAQRFRVGGKLLFDEFDPVVDTGAGDFIVEVVGRVV